MAQRDLAGHSVFALAARHAVMDFRRRVVADALAPGDVLAQFEPAARGRVVEPLDQRAARDVFLIDLGERGQEGVEKPLNQRPGQRRGQLDRLPECANRNRVTSIVLCQQERGSDPLCFVFVDEDGEEDAVH